MNELPEPAVVPSSGPNATPRRSVHPAAVGVFRGLVCLQIVGMHAFAGDVSRLIIEHTHPSTAWAVSHLRFGFGSFFVLAGYFLAHTFRPGEWSRLSLAAFVGRRVVRLAVPYWAAIAFGIGGFWLSSQIRGREYQLPTFDQLWPLVLFVHDLFPAKLQSIAYWFMAPLFQFYLLWGFGFWLARRWYLARGDEGFHDKAVRVMMILTGAWFFLALGVEASGVEFAWRLAGLPGALLCLGCLTYWQICGKPVGTILVLALIATVGVGALVGSSRLIASAVTVGLLVAFSRWPVPVPDSLLTRVFGLIGHWSFSIYLTHTYIVYRVLNIPNYIEGISSPVSAVALWGLAIAGSVALGGIFYNLVERPAAALSRRISFREAKPTAAGAA